MAHSTQLDLEEHVARIDRALTETAKYAIEQRRLGAQTERYERNLCRMVVISMVAGASFGAGAAFMKLLIG